MATPNVDFSKSATTQGRDIIGTLAMRIGRAARTGDDVAADTLQLASIALKSLARGANIGDTHTAFLQDAVEVGLLDEADADA